MTTTFPTALDVFTNPAADDSQASAPTHSQQHANVNDAIEAIEAKVGIDSLPAGGVSRSLQDKMREVVSVKDFGAVGDGVTDDTSAIQAALNASLCVFFPAGDYKLTSGITMQAFQSIYGPTGYSQGATSQGQGSNARLVFSGTGAACISQSAPGSNFLHTSIDNITVMCTGTYTWMLDLTTVIGLKMTNCLFQATGDSTGGYHTAKIGGAGFSWSNKYHNVQIVLPITSTKRVVDTDTSDSVWVGGVLGGGLGTILRGTGGWRLIDTLINNATYGITISVETESLSQHIIANCQIEENSVAGLLIDGDANDALAETDVNFVVSGCSFRNPTAGQEIVFQNATGPVLQGGVISGCMFTAPSSLRIVRTPARWKYVTVSGNTQQNATTAQNNFVGTQFLPSPLVVAQSAVAASHTGDTNDFTFATVSIPANALGVNGRIKVTTLWSHTNSANNKTLNVKFDGTAFTADVVTTTLTSRVFTEIANRNATNSQVGGPANFAGSGSTTAAVVTAAVDTTVSKNITITGQLASAGETITLEGYVVEVLRGE